MYFIERLVYSNHNLKYTIPQCLLFRFVFFVYFDTCNSKSIYN